MKTLLFTFLIAWSAFSFTATEAESEQISIIMEDDILIISGPGIEVIEIFNDDEILVYEDLSCEERNEVDFSSYAPGTYKVIAGTDEGEVIEFIDHN